MCKTFAHFARGCRAECSTSFGPARARCWTGLSIGMEGSVRKAIMILAFAVLLGGASAAFADGGSINYTVTSTITSINQPFTFTFSEPATLTSLTTFVPVTFSAGGSSTVFAGEVEFFDRADAGLFDVDFSEGGDLLTFEFGGKQIFKGKGPFSLKKGKFPVELGDILVNGTMESFLTGGKVTAVATTPEPASFALLGLGLAGLGVLRKKRLA